MKVSIDFLMTKDCRRCVFYVPPKNDMVKYCNRNGGHDIWIPKTKPCWSFKRKKLRSFRNSISKRLEAI